MKLKAYGITAQRTLEEFPAESLSPDWYEDATHRWLDIEGGEPEAWRELLAPFDLHPLVLEACTEPGGGGRVESVPGEGTRCLSARSGEYAAKRPQRGRAVRGAFVRPSSTIRDDTAGQDEQPPADSDCHFGGVSATHAACRHLWHEFCAHA